MYTFLHSESRMLKKEYMFDCCWIDDSPEYILFSYNHNQEVIKAFPFEGDIVDDHILTIIKKLEIYRKK